MDVHRIQISGQALNHNLRLVRGLTGPKTRVMAVVKSNAYGHGFHEVLEAIGNEADWLGVNHLDEALAIRNADVDRPILIMGLNHGELDRWAEHESSLVDCHFVLSSLDALKHLHKVAPRASFHLKADTGLTRLGSSGKQLQACLQYLEKHPELHWTGLMTHFANVEDVTDQSYALAQLQRFSEVRGDAMAAAKGRRLIVHAAASAAALILPESHLDMIRLGISLYGLWPSVETRLSSLSLHERILELKPALSWRSKIVHINHGVAGRSVGYGCTHRLTADARLAVVPVGYFEGYDRSLSNRGHVIVRGDRAPVVGRVSMNMISVDITHIEDARVGDEATLIGSEEGDSITAEDLAAIANTINYEIVTRIHPDLPRILID